MGAGQLATRTWAHLTSDLRPLTSTYSYSPCCGALTAISYSDGTPAVSFALDRLGRQKTITDATGTRSFTYNDALQLSSEASPFGTITRQYDTLGRPSGYTLVNPVNPVTPVQTVTHGYSADGRFGSLSATTVHIVAIQSRVRRAHSNPPVSLLPLFHERTASAYHFDNPQAILGREKLKSLPKPGLPAPGHALPPPEMLT
jgi:hypothetical protein